MDPYQSPCCMGLRVLSPVNILPKDSQRLLVSLGCAVGSVSSVMALVCLVQSDQPNANGIVAVGFSFGRVVVPLSLGLLLASMSWLIAMPLAVRANPLPFIWLFPLTLTLVWFVVMYDWRGVYMMGRARDWWGYPIRHDSRAILFLAVSFVVWAATIFNSWRVSRRRSPETDRIESIAHAHRAEQSRNRDNGGM